MARPARTARCNGRDRTAAVASVAAARWAVAAAVAVAAVAARQRAAPAAAAPPRQAAGGCDIVGTVERWGGGDHGGVVVQAGTDGPSATTDAAGRFALIGVAAGMVRLTAVRPRHLSAAADDVPCRAGGRTTMAAVALPAGDADGNDRVDLFDLVRVAAHYRQCAADPDFEPLADLDDSGCIDLFDLVRVTGAYGLDGPRPWAVAAVDDGTPEPDPEAVSFQGAVLPIFSRDCRTCHGYVAGLNLESYASLMAGGNSGPSIVPGDPQASLLYRKVSRQLAPYMPPGGVRLSDDDIATIRRWIEAGAPDN